MIGLTLFLLISILLSWCGTKQQVPFAKQVFIFLLILILGLRHDVGRDYPTYELIYNVPDSVQANATEPIWHLINYILRYLGFQARGFFFFTSVIVMVCFYKGIKIILRISLLGGRKDKEIHGLDSFCRFISHQRPDYFPSHIIKPFPLSAYFAFSGISHQFPVWKHYSEHTH